MIDKKKMRLDLAERDGKLEVTGSAMPDYPLPCYDCGKAVFTLGETGRHLSHGGVLCKPCHGAALPKITCAVCKCLVRKNDSIKDRYCSFECAENPLLEGLDFRVLSVVNSERRKWTAAEVAHEVQADLDIVRRTLEMHTRNETIDSDAYGSAGAKRHGMLVSYWKNGDPPPDSLFLAGLEEIP